MKFWGSSFNFHWTKTDFYRWSSTSLEIKTTHLDLEFRDVPPVFHDKNVKNLWWTIDIGVFWCILLRQTFFRRAQTKLRIRLLGFDQGADPKEEAGVSMAQTKVVRLGCQRLREWWRVASLKIIRHKSLQSKETVLYTWYDSLYTCINQLFVVKNIHLIPENMTSFDGFPSGHGSLLCRACWQILSTVGGYKLRHRHKNWVQRRGYIKPIFVEAVKWGKSSLIKGTNQMWLWLVQRSMWKSKQQMGDTHWGTFKQRH